MFFVFLVLAQNKRNKNFKKNPIGWQVKYWIDGDDYYGTVINTNLTDEVLIKTFDGEKMFFINDVNAIRSPKNNPFYENTGS